MAEVGRIGRSEGLGMPEIPFSPPVHTLTAVLQVCVAFLLCSPALSFPPVPETRVKGRAASANWPLYSLFFQTLTATHCS